MLKSRCRNAKMGVRSGLSGDEHQIGRSQRFAVLASVECCLPSAKDQMMGLDTHRS